MQTSSTLTTRKNQEKDKALNKTLVYYRTRRYQYKKNTPTRIILRKRRSDKMAIHKTIIPN